MQRKWRDLSKQGFQAEVLTPVEQRCKKKKKKNAISSDERKNFHLMACSQEGKNDYEFVMNSRIYIPPGLVAKRTWVE